MGERWIVARMKRKQVEQNLNLPQHPCSLQLLTPSTRFAGACALLEKTFSFYSSLEITNCIYISIFFCQAAVMPFMLWEKQSQCTQEIFPVKLIYRVNRFKSQYKFDALGCSTEVQTTSLQMILCRVQWKFYVWGLEMLLQRHAVNAECV